MTPQSPRAFYGATFKNAFMPNVMRHQLGSRGVGQQRVINHDVANFIQNKL
jgi:hypothetical protein